MAVKLMTGTFAPDARRPSCEKDNIPTVLSAPAAYPDAFNSRGRLEEKRTTVITKVVQATGKFCLHCGLKRTSSDICAGDSRWNGGSRKLGDWMKLRRSCQLCFCTACNLEVGFARFNLFPAPACEISWLKDARTRLRIIFSRSYNTSTFSALRFDENPVTLKKETKRLKNLKFRSFIGRFQVTSWR